MTNALFTQCQWPDNLSPHHDTALREAVRYTLNRFGEAVLGIIATGTIIRGNPKANSDFDIHIIYAHPQRQRIQKYFNAVPVELFINPPSRMEQYYAEQRATGIPSAAHMLATGFVILDRDLIIAQLIRQATDFLTLPPNPSSIQLDFMRYHVVDRYENAQDIQHSHPLNARLILTVSVYEMLRYRFLAAKRNIPRDKDLLTALDDFDPTLASLMQDFLSAADVDQQFAIAKTIADKTIGVQRFFEWESPPEDV